jgi:hypothetical protein
MEGDICQNNGYCLKRTNSNPSEPDQIFPGIEKKVEGQTGIRYKKGPGALGLRVEILDTQSRERLVAYVEKRMNSDIQ